jgi:hypothetical protein
MGEIRKMNNRIFMIVCIGVFCSGCALSRGQIDIPIAKVVNPVSSVIVKFSEINDRRVFEVNPRKANIPSLKEGAPSDKTIKKRAVARKRNSFGAALGDIILPEGRTVEHVIEEALTKALRESGIRVVSKGEAGYDTARPVQADIMQFWAWFRPGFWAITMEYEARVVLRGNWPIAESDREILSEARLTGQIASSSEWRRLFSKGVDNLIDNVKRVIQRTSEQLKSAPDK